MQLVKIHELPSITFDQLKDIDIFVVENADDTYKITTADLKLIFSNDAKIQAIYNSLLEYIQNLNKSVEDMNTSYSQAISNILNKVELMEENLSAMNAKIVLIEANITDIDTRLDSINADLSSLTTRVSNVEQTVDQHTTQIENIQQTLNTHTSNISDLQDKDTDLQRQIDEMNKQIQSLAKTIQDINTVSMDTINQIRIEITEGINTKYEEIMNILDDKFHQTPIICDEN